MTNAQILVVEDEGIIAKGIENTLKSLGYAVPAIVSSGEEAMKKAAEARPDLVLMDIVLKGDMDGVEAAEQIRDLFHIPVIYLTSYSDDKTLQRAKIAEPYGYILKPFNERELDTSIKIALYKHKMERNLEESEQWLVTTLNSIADAVIATDTNGCVKLMNPVAEALTGWKQEDAIGEPLQEVFNIINERTGEQAENPFLRVLREGVVTGLENQTVLIAKDETKWPIDDSGAPIKDYKGNIIGMVLVFRDITKRKMAEEALQKARDELELRVQERTDDLVRANEALEEAQKRYKELWDGAPVAYHTLDTGGVITQVNQTEIEMLGYTREEMLGKPIFDFILPEQRKDAEERFRLKLAGERIPKHDNRIYVKKDGSKMYVSIDDVLEYDSDENVIGVRTTMIDITKGKQAEEALKRSEANLRRLSSQLLEVQENERKRISWELHDSMGQVLASVSVGLGNAVSSIRAGMASTTVGALETLISVVQEASEEVRKLHTDLRPPLLDDLGVITTISWFCREFEKLHSGIQIERQINIEEKQVPEPLKIVIFRLLQESLNNVSKHANADLVRVSLKGTAGTIELVIEDNGKGFDIERDRSLELPSTGFGLTSMKERTQLSGGTFSIQSMKGAGTTVRASWQ